jgi:hypothetical protein
VKLLRLSLILLLAVLLPVRGALAAAMLCAPAPVAAAQAHGEHAEHGHHGHAHEAAADPAPEHAAHGEHAGHKACTQCAAFCSLTPLAETGRAPPDAVALPAASFPPLATQAVRFERDGPERPPRTV